MEMTFVFFDFEVLCIDEKTGFDALWEQGPNAIGDSTWYSNVCAKMCETAKQQY
jgi:hypothetical protein